MANLLIGSSNVYRFYKLVTSKEQNKYTMIGCTNLEVWSATVDDIRMEKGEVIISIIENLICDDVVEVEDPEARRIIIEDVVKSFLEQVRKCAFENPGVKFALVQPMMRPKHQWYSDGHGTLCKIFNDTIKEMRAQNVAKIDGPPIWTQVFSPDGVHLTEAAGKFFVESIITEAEVFFKQEIIDLEKERQTNPEPILTDDPKWIAERIKTVEKEIGRLNRDLLE
jgi:hypothetical protein